MYSSVCFIDTEQDIFVFGLPRAKATSELSVCGVCVYGVIEETERMGRWKSDNFSNVHTLSGHMSY